MAPAGRRTVWYQLHWLFLFRVTALSVLLGIAFLLQAPDRTPFVIPPLNIAYFIAGVYAFTIASALALPRVDNLPRYAFLQVLVDVVLAGLLVYFSGGSQSIFTLVFFFPIIAVGLMSLPAYRIVLILFSIVTYGTVLLLEYAGIQPPLTPIRPSPLANSPQALLYQFAIPAMTFFLVGFLSSMLAERIRRTEAALSEKSHNLDRLALLHRQILDDVATGIFTVDARGRISSWNRAAAEITGYSLAQALGRPLAALLPDLATAGGRDNRATATVTRRDGTVIPIGFSRARLNLPDEAGTNLVFTFQDLSAIRKMEEQVRQAEKMASVGRMAAGIAHEFRNPLAAISGAAQMLAESPEATQNRRLMDIILRESDRLSAIISEFLMFSKPAAMEPQWFNLRGFLEETVQVLHQGNRLSCPVDLQVAGDLDCWGDRQMLRQVFLNLLDNACQATGDPGGVVEVHAVERETGDNSGVLVVTVADRGVGIDDEAAPRLFEPFFTTRKNGTGLGLAIAWQIVDSHGGTLRLDNRDPGPGAVATVTLPLP